MLHHSSAKGGLEKGGLLEGGLRSPLPRGRGGGGGGQKVEGLKGGLNGVLYTTLSVCETVRADTSFSAEIAKAGSPRAWRAG